MLLPSIPSLTITIFQCYTGYLFLSHFLPVYCVLGVIFFCFITLLTSLSHFISDLALLFLSPGNQVNICQGHLLSPMHNLCPYHFNILLSIVYRNVCVIPILFLFTSLLAYNILDVLAVLLKNPFLYLTAFS